MPENFITTRSVTFEHFGKVQAELLLWGASDIRHIAAHGVIEWMFQHPRKTEDECKALVNKINALHDVQVTDQTFYRTRKLR